MSVCVLRGENEAAMYCNTSDWAFGPVFSGPYAADDAEAFLTWHFKKYGDPRSCDDSELERHYGEWRALPREDAA